MLSLLHSTARELGADLREESFRLLRALLGLLHVPDTLLEFTEALRKRLSETVHSLLELA